MSKFSQFFLVGFLALSSLLNACSDKKHTTHPKDMLRIDIGAEIPTLDPQLVQDVPSARVAYDLFARLVDFDQKNNPIPGMASKWEISPDEKTITFHLRKHLKFSDGSPITAHDFVYSWRRLIDPSTSSAYDYLLAQVVNARVIMKGKMPAEKLGIFAPNNHTLIVKFANPDSAFIQKCTLPSLSVVPQKTIQKYGTAWTNVNNMVSSGAYKLKEHIVNGYILSEKNSFYYDADQVKIPFIKYFPYADVNTSLAAYQSNGLDITQGVPVNRYKELKRTYPTELHNFKQESIYYYDFNMMLPEFRDNIKLRQALSMAIDREIISTFILQSSPTPLYSVVTPTVAKGEYADIEYSWKKKSRAQQIKEAKRLYQEAGYSAANPLKISISINSDILHQKLALAIAAMWKEVLGVKAGIQAQEWKTFINARKNGNYVIARDGWAADYNAIDTYLILYQCGNSQNNSHYCNHKYNKFMSLGEANIDLDAQKKLYHEALQIALESYATIPITQGNATNLVKPYVKNYYPEHNFLNHVQSKWMHF